MQNRGTVNAWSVKIGDSRRFGIPFADGLASRFAGTLLHRLILRTPALVLSDSRKMRTLLDHQTVDKTIVVRTSDAIPLLLTHKDTLWIHR